MAAYDPASDVLSIAGQGIPPSGQLGNTRFAVSFPASMVFSNDMNGGLVPVATRATSAALAISVLEHDIANDILWALSNEQDRTRAVKAPWPGSGVIMRGPLVGRTVRWSDSWVEQKPDFTSAGSVTVLTWTLQLADVVVT
jgi:hypothetical protein